MTLWLLMELLALSGTTLLLVVLVLLMRRKTGDQR
jgi:hypothetical protein